VITLNMESEAEEVTSILELEEVATRLNLSPRAIIDLTAIGTFPTPMWNREAVEAWAERNLELARRPSSKLFRCDVVSRHRRKAIMRKQADRGK
jgi:hypothetical protein